MIYMRTQERLSLRVIGERVGLSSERVRQLLKREGVVFTWPVKPANAPTRRGPLNPEAVRSMYGCSVKALEAIQGDRLLNDHFSPAFVYRTQRFRYARAKRWGFTFPQWWALWSPHWKQRLVENLVMVPVDKSKAIGPANVEITTRSEVMDRYWRQRLG
jgi:hypothetical protein